MYQPMLFLHWKQIKVALIPLIMAAFGLPLLSVQGLGGTDPALQSVAAYSYLMYIQTWLPAFPLLAGAIGITLALSSWNWDHQLHHVYALSLPIPRWRYATLKMGAGLVLALLPAAGFWAGAHLAAASVTLPVGLNAYPDALALRFTLAVLVSYAAFFALAAGTVRTTMILVTGLIALLLVGGSLTTYLADNFDVFRDTNMVQVLVEALSSRHGPLEVFSGSWMLFDV